MTDSRLEVYVKRYPASLSVMFPDLDNRDPEFFEIRIAKKIFAYVERKTLRPSMLRMGTRFSILPRDVQELIAELVGEEITKIISGPRSFDHVVPLDQATSTRILASWATLAQKALDQERTD